MKHIKISVILPCYNVKDYIKRCLDRIINQTLKDIEIICVDDKSTDNTLQILQKYSKNEKRIKIIELEKNSGAGTARNTGLKLAKGEYVSFIDPDDYIDLNFYEKLYNTAFTNNYDVIKGAVCIHNSKDQTTHISNLNSKILQNHINFYGEHWSAIYKKDFLISNNIFYPEDVITGQDSVFLSILVTKHPHIGILNDTYYHYLLNRPNSLDSIEFSHEKILSRIKMLNYKKSLLLNSNFLSKSDIKIFIKNHILTNFYYTFNKKFEKATDKELLFDWLVNAKLPKSDLLTYFGKHKATAIIKNRYNKFISPEYKMHLFYKERCPNSRRHIYFLGFKIFSYKKKQRSENITENLTDIPVKYISEDRLPVYLRDVFFKKTGKLPTENLNTFSEKVIWASMFDATKLKVQCTDKLAVREYVRKTVGEKYLPDLYAVYKKPDDFSLEDLPDSFLLTYNAGANGDFNKIITNKNMLNIDEIKNTMRKWLLYNHSEPACEMQYRYIKPRIIARELLDIREDIEYKLWCFNGKVEFICLNSYVRGHNAVGFATFDKEWNKLDFYQSGGDRWHITEDIKKPKFLKELVSVSEKLAKPFNFVRVDFYETKDGKIKFGELTFSPSSGTFTFYPNNEKIQLIYGNKFIIPERNEMGFSKRNNFIK